MTQIELNQLQALLDKLFAQFANEKPTGIELWHGATGYQLSLERGSNTVMHFGAATVAECYHRAVSDILRQQEDQ
jgi:hypothetical protein